MVSDIFILLGDSENDLYSEPIKTRWHYMNLSDSLVGAQPNKWWAERQGRRKAR